MFPCQCVFLKKRWKLFKEAFVVFWNISVNSHPGYFVLFFSLSSHYTILSTGRQKNKEQQAVRMWHHLFPCSSVAAAGPTGCYFSGCASHPCVSVAQKLRCCDAFWARSLFMFRNGRVRAIDTHQHPAAYYFLPVLASHQALTWQVDGVHKEIMSWASFPGKLLTLFTNSGLQIEGECGWEEVVKGCSGLN